MASLEKMNICACELDRFGNITNVAELKTGSVDQNVFTVMINPSSVKWNHSISYSKQKIQGASAKEAKFNQIEDENVSFEMIFDGTGLIPPVVNNKSESESIDRQIDKFKRIVYNFYGKEHQTRPVYLFWGTLNFCGRLESLTIDYTLFKPSGIPLRAKSNLSFVKYISKQEAALRANKSSPDLTHLVEVQAGDTLPLLCHRIYRNPAYYSEVARINDLNSPQALRPGLKLKFPPLS